MKESRTWGDLWFLIKNRKWPDRKEYEFVLEKRWEMKVIYDNYISRSSTILPDSDEYCGKSIFDEVLKWFLESNEPYFHMIFNNGNERIFVRDVIIEINIISNTKKVKKEKQLNG